MENQQTILRPSFSSATSTSEFEQFKQGMGLMESVVREMKEIPELPSEEPKDTAALYKVEISDEVGVITWMMTHPYPYHGFPYFEFVDKIDILKKVIRNVASGIYHSLKHHNRFLFLTAIPAFWMSKTAVRATLYTFYRIIERIRIKPKRYSPAMQALYQAFSIDRDQERLGSKELRFMLRDVLCMVMEFDNAYRFRFQALITELNKENLTKNPTKEFIRLLDILASWEDLQEQKDKWRLVKYAFKYYLRYDREIRNILKDVFLAIDIEKMKLNANDKYFCIKRQDIQMPFIKEASGQIETLNEEQKADRLIIERAKLRDRQMAQASEINQSIKDKQKALLEKQEQELKVLDGLIESQTKQMEELTKQYEAERIPSLEAIKLRHNAENDALGREFEPIVKEIEQRQQKEVEELVAKLK